MRLIYSCDELTFRPKRKVNVSKYVTLLKGAPDGCPPTQVKLSSLHTSGATSDQALEHVRSASV